MAKTKRQIAFVLASTDHGTLIFNRNDQHSVGSSRYGVGIEILTNSSFCPEEVDLALQLLDLRRTLFGDGVVAIDCGANVGVHAIDWGRCMTGWGRVVAIEAQERIYYALAGNVAINNCFNVQAIHAAATDADGTLRIPVPNYMEQASFGSLELKPLPRPENIGQTIDYRDEAMTPVRALRLDSLGLERLDLIKIDVEGMEIDVLRGAAEMLEKHKPIMLIEHHKSDMAVLTEWLRDKGYRLYNPGGMNLLVVHRDDPANDHVSERSV